MAESSLHHFSYSVEYSALSGSAPQIAVALVAHHGEDLGLGQGAAEGSTLSRHERTVVAEVGAGRIAVERQAGDRERLRAGVHQVELVLDVREGQQHLTVAELAAGAASAVRAVAARARAGEQRGAGTERAADDHRPGRERTDVHERPQREDGRAPSSPRPGPSCASCRPRRTADRAWPPAAGGVAGAAGALRRPPVRRRCRERPALRLPARRRLAAARGTFGSSELASVTTATARSPGDGVVQGMLRGVSVTPGHDRPRLPPSREILRRSAIPAHEFTTGGHWQRVVLEMPRRGWPRQMVRRPWCVSTVQCAGPNHLAAPAAASRASAPA